MSDLLVKPNEPDANGRIIHVTPESAGWRYVGFDLHLLPAGKSLAGKIAGREALLVFVAGLGSVECGAATFKQVGSRMTPFDDAPHSVYVPPETPYHVTAATDLELAICTAPAAGKFRPRHIAAEAVEKLTRGRGTNTRYVRNILPETEDAESLLIVESVTPGGHWSSYPPHKHDTDNFPYETYLEETYYHRLRPSQGYGFQRVYTDDQSIDETMTVYDRNLVMVPRGYHPVSSPYGFNLYYLNVMAGPLRKWRFHNQKSHDFLLVE
jgi:5-deoxy-glucuronate isomerase